MLDWFFYVLGVNYALEILVLSLIREIMISYFIMVEPVIVEPAEVVPATEVDPAIPGLQAQKSFNPLMESQIT